MDATTPTKVTLGAKEFELVPPASYSVRHEVAMAGLANRYRAYAAALGLCAPSIERRLKVHPYAVDYNPLAYGGRIFDGLIAAGLPRADVIAAGAAAYALIQEGLFSDEEVEAAEGFTDPPPEGGIV